MESKLFEAYQKFTFEMSRDEEMKKRRQSLKNVLINVNLLSLDNCDNLNLNLDLRGETIEKVLISKIFINNIQDRVSTVKK